MPISNAFGSTFIPPSHTYSTNQPTTQLTTRTTHPGLEYVRKDVRIYNPAGHSISSEKMNRKDVEAALNRVAMGRPIVWDHIEQHGTVTAFSLEEEAMFRALKHSKLVVTKYNPTPSARDFTFSIEGIDNLNGGDVAIFLNQTYGNENTNFFAVAEYNSNKSYCDSHPGVRHWNIKVKPRVHEGEGDLHFCYIRCDNEAMRDRLVDEGSFIIPTSPVPTAIYVYAVSERTNNTHSMKFQLTPPNLEAWQIKLFLAHCTGLDPSDFKNFYKPRDPWTKQGENYCYISVTTEEHFAVCKNTIINKFLNYQGYKIICRRNDIKYEKGQKREPITNSSIPPYFGPTDLHQTVYPTINAPSNTNNQDVQQTDIGTPAQQNENSNTPTPVASVTPFKLTTMYRNQYGSMFTPPPIDEEKVKSIQAFLDNLPQSVQQPNLVQQPIPVQQPNPPQQTQQVVLSTTTQPNNSQDTTPAYIKALLDQMKTMQNEINQLRNDLWSSEEQAPATTPVLPDDDEVLDEAAPLNENTTDSAIQSTEEPSNSPKKARHD